MFTSKISSNYDEEHLINEIKEDLTKLKDDVVINQYKIEDKESKEIIESESEHDSDLDEYLELDTVDTSFTKVKFNIKSLSSLFYLCDWCVLSGFEAYEMILRKATFIYQANHRLFQVIGILCLSILTFVSSK